MQEKTISIDNCLFYNLIFGSPWPPFLNLSCGAYNCGTCFLFTNLLTPSLAGINHLLESLGILLRTVVALESILFRHHHVFLFNAPNIINFIEFKARIDRIMRKKVQFSSRHAEKWMIICNFVGRERQGSGRGGG